MPSLLNSGEVSGFNTYCRVLDPYCIGLCSCGENGGDFRIGCLKRINISRI